MASFATLAFDKIQCLPLARVWIEGVNNGICTQGFRGMTNIWIVVLLNYLMLFGAMVSATFFMPMFVEREPLESSKKEAEEDEEEGDAVAGEEGGGVEGESVITDGQYQPLPQQQQQQESQQEGIEMTSVNSRNESDQTNVQDREGVADADSDSMYELEHNQIVEEEKHEAEFGMSNVE